jgi:deoxyribodipyrimidine photolyase-related protein
MSASKLLIPILGDQLSLSNPTLRSGDNACPMTVLYWDFLDRHREELDRNPRAALMMKNYRRIEPTQMEAIRRTAKHLLNNLDSI